VSDAAYARWCATCVRPQRQEGYAAVIVALPAGRITAQQMRALADIAERFNVRTRASIDQNVVLRWARVEVLPGLYCALREHDLARPIADTPLDPVACPGAETCASAVTNGKALARALITHLESSSLPQDDGTARLRIRISGCPNACGHHPVGDIGLYGGALHVEGRLLPIYHLLVNDNGFGRLLARVPARRVPAAVEALIAAYQVGRQPDEPFRAFVRRVGKDELQRAIDHLLTPPAFYEEPGAYVDWEGDKLFSLDERGEGECAV
jgi:sulfite reductase beta subunit-like hemoprotein